jgi:hypothetical protein
MTIIKDALLKAGLVTKEQAEFTGLSWQALKYERDRAIAALVQARKAHRATRPIKARVTAAVTALKFAKAA